MSRRKKGNGGNLGKGWAPLYEPVLCSDAVRTLNAAHFKVYITVCALCKPWFNGAVPLSRKVLREFGIVSGSTVNRALTVLLERNLIVRTREARPRHAALYGVAHLPLNLEAMKKAGAHAPTQSAQRTESAHATPSNTETEFSVRSADQEGYHQRTESGPDGPNSVRPADRIRPFSTPNSVRSADTSKNLPGPTGSGGGSDDSL